MAYSLLEKCISLEPDNEEYLYNFAVFLEKTGEINYAREIAARLLRIDKNNKTYLEMFVDISHKIEQEKESIFYRSQLSE